MYIYIYIYIYIYTLPGVIGSISRFHEGSISLTADMKSIFLQVQVPEQDRSYMNFLCRQIIVEPVQI